MSEKHWVCGVYNEEGKRLEVVNLDDPRRYGGGGLQFMRFQKPVTIPAGGFLTQPIEVDDEERGVKKIPVSQAEYERMLRRTKCPQCRAKIEATYRVVWSA